jgi:hypothetical protein
MKVTTLNDLEPAARHPAEQLIRLLTVQEPTGEEPLMAIFELALERLSNVKKNGMVHNVLIPGAVCTCRTPIVNHVR